MSQIITKHFDPAGHTSKIKNDTCQTTHDQELRDVAVKLEATFLAEMLKSAGLGSMPSEFGGGAGEEQFSSLMRHEQALQIAKRGGIGLAEAIFRSLKG